MTALLATTVTIRDRDTAIPAAEVCAFAPAGLPESPLAVTNCHRFNGDEWTETPGFCLTHRPTGFRIGVKEKWDTVEEAMVVLLRCEPDFPAWNVAGSNAGALEACRYKWRCAREAA